MRVAGTATVNAPAERVYAALNDPAVLVRTIPGCERLEAVTPERFRMTITAGVASIKGSYAGEVELADPAPPGAFTLRASGAGAPGTVSADVRIRLDAADDTTTTVSYDADAVVGGAVGGVGQRVLGAVARRTATEFFAALDAELNSSSPEPAAPADEPVVEGHSDVPAPRTYARPAAPGGDPTAAVLAGGGIALAGVLLGWLIGRRR